MGFEQEDVFTVRIKAYFQLFLYKCSQNAIKKNGPGSFKMVFRYY